MSRWTGFALIALAACRGEGAPDGEEKTSRVSSDSETSPPSTTPPTESSEPSGDEPDFRPRVATLRASAEPPVFSGYLYEGALPWDYEEVAREGACRALSLGIPSCDPACAAGEICVGDGLCAPFPRLLSAGRLTIEGLAGATAIEPTDPPVYSAGIGALPGPDDRVRVEAEGDALGPFVLETAGVAPLLLDGGVPERAPGEDLVLRWTPDPGARIRARFAVDYAHRLAPEVVECEGPDEGELVVPGALLDRVTESPDWGCGACFPHRVERYRGDRADAGIVPVDLEVVSVVQVSPWL